jgi:hypothetical protein
MTELNQPDHIISLATSSLLVSVDVNVWTATKQDKGISNEITSSKKADESAGKFVKYLFANNEQHKKIVNHRQAIYTWVKQSTYRWNDSQDLIPTANLISFKEEYGYLKDTFNELVDDFVSKYQTLVSDMAFKHGDMFDVNDYPDVEHVRDKFDINLYVSEVPSHDFRCSISEDIARDLKQEYEHQAEQIVNNVVTQQTHRVLDVMKSISHCCGVVERNTPKGEIVTVKRAIYDVTFDKAKALINTCKKFQPVKNEMSTKLDSAIKELDQSLGGVTTQSLRESDAIRDKVKSDIDNILSKFN